MASRWDLAELWAGHVERLGGRDAGTVETAFQAIERAYSEPHRAYHTLDHLRFVFEKLGEHAGQAEDPLRLAFAAWYHDIIYDPLAKDNEERSAILAIDTLPRLGADDAFTARVARLIRATAAHKAGGADHDDDLFLDADFSILGAPQYAYQAYVAQVRKEYQAFDDAAWKAGRTAFLKGALTGGPLFRTRTFEDAYAASARANLAWELETLGA